MNAFLSIVSVSATIAIAVYTWKLTAATKEMADLQKKVVDLQQELNNKQGELAKLQTELARADLFPDIAVSLATTPQTGVRITNLGKYGVEVLALYHTADHDFVPTANHQPYTPAPQHEQFPIGLPPRLHVTVVNAYPPDDRPVVAVVFRHRNSTLIGRWRYTKEHGLRFFQRLGEYDSLDAAYTHRS